MALVTEGAFSYAIVLQPAPWGFQEKNDEKMREGRLRGAGSTGIVVTQGRHFSAHTGKLGLLTQLNLLKGASEEGLVLTSQYPHGQAHCGLSSQTPSGLGMWGAVLNPVSQPVLEWPGSEGLALVLLWGPEGKLRKVLL